MIDRYTKGVLTVIAVALVALVIQNAIRDAVAASSQPQPVFIAQVGTTAAKCLAGHLNLFGGDTGGCIYW